MGNSKSNGTSKGKGSSDDGCIGNRKVRTIVLSALLAAFFVFACPYPSKYSDLFKDLKDTPLGAGELLCAGAAGDTDVSCDDWITAYTLVMVGAIVCIVGCVLCVILFFIAGQEQMIGRIAGFILLIGGILYLVGWIMVMLLMRPSDDVYDLYTDDAKQQLDSALSVMFGEALLAGGSAILLGADAAFQMYENEAFRLASNLGIILAVACFCCPSYYAQMCPADPDTIGGIEVPCETPDGVAAIATGYGILIITCAAYIILYICTCLTCNCKDACLVRVLFAVALVVGGILCAIGYWASLNVDDANFDDDSLTTARTVYYIGYTFLIGGLCCVWALDIAFDDVKNNKK
eukprot:CAMPEP_0197024382 /NCGR_PEP_ID=MMETSP1384-20130603/4930_1 /TAXON_ID=29189 /ORGANISM="Ammonia sp." /LENGTH=347 /DNA_ID=CAMNT_0042452755 /DNA_START=836 /DNA_END=1879 /DNA_ORIENTATION=-